MGGLGNQMFQYAAGRRLSHVHNAELKLDISSFNSKNFRTSRHYELKPLNIIGTVAEGKDVPPQLQGRGTGIMRWLHVGRGVTQTGLRHIQEAHYHFDPAVLQLPDGVYLEGYWQSEKYFSDVSELIRSDFTIRGKPDGRNAALLEEIAGCNAVSVHVRRGDYLYDEAVKAVHPVCEMDYYGRALEYIAERVTSPVLYIFSDETEWVKSHFKFPFPTIIVDHNGVDKGYEDMRLMRHCAHHVIANSSFSWWGAWLNSNPNKIVVAPERWFGSSQWDTKDLIPEAWVRL
jgi:hypothetical protein